MNLGGMKKPVRRIRPPQKPVLEVSIEEQTNRLSAAIKQIQNFQSNKLSYEELYRYAYNIVLHKKGEDLYRTVKSLITSHLVDQANDLILPVFPRSPIIPPSPSSSSSSSAAAISSSTIKGKGKASTSAGAAAAGGIGAGSSMLGSEMSALERGTEGEVFLKALRRVWEDHKSCMAKLRDVLKYMDKVYTDSAKLPPIYTAGLTLFLNTIIRSPSPSPLASIHAQIISTLLSQIRLERDGQVIDRSAMHNAVQILLDLSEREGGASIYETDFEKGFLEWTAEFYREEGERLVEDCEAGVYLRKVERRLEEESYRTSHYLSQQTSHPLLSLLETHLLTAHLKTILSKPQSGLVPMLDGNKLDDLSRLYKLFGRPGVPTGIKELKRALKESVKERGEKINEGGGGALIGGGVTPGESVEKEKEKEDGDVAAVEGAKGKGKPTKELGGTAVALANAIRWVQNVLDLKDKFDGVLRDAFAGDKGIQTAINEAFETFVNSNPKSAEYISLFIDDNLKKGLKGKTEDEVDIVLDKTITLFRFLTDKDVFERYYKTHLGKRLINGRSVSDDAERNMVAKLKIECGYQFTQKLEGMFKDIQVSNETMDAYRSHATSDSPIDLSVNVLTSTYWPGSAQPQPTLLPPVLASACTAFEKFYLSRHNGRRLTWQSNQGTADVRTKFKARTHELNVSTYALIVLLLFEELEEGEELEFSDILGSTLIPAPDLARTLQSLACGKYRILTKHPKSRDVSPTDSFAFNDNFTAPIVKIKIATVANKVETGEERTETVEKVDEERKHQAEACIVRIMKSAKAMNHNELVNEVTKQLAPRFAPSVSLIKKRIEALIEREYLERSGKDMRSYTYLA